MENMTNSFIARIICSLSGIFLTFDKKGSDKDNPTRFSSFAG